MTAAPAAEGTAEVELAQATILAARRAMPEAQRLLDRPVAEALGTVEVGWHARALDPEWPAFALADPDGPAAGCVGEIVALTFGARRAVVFCHRFVDALPWPLSVPPRVLVALGHPADAPLACRVEVLR